MKSGKLLITCIFFFFCTYFYFSIGDILILSLVLALLSFLLLICLLFLEKDKTVQ
jgi:hypothetical protein